MCGHAEFSILLTRNVHVLVCTIYVHMFYIYVLVYWIYTRVTVIALFVCVCVFVFRCVRWTRWEFSAAATHRAPFLRRSAIVKRRAFEHSAFFLLSLVSSFLPSFCGWFFGVYERVYVYTLYAPQHVHILNTVCPPHAWGAKRSQSIRGAREDDDDVWTQFIRTRVSLAYATESDKQSADKEIYIYIHCDVVSPRHAAMLAYQCTHKHVYIIHCDCTQHFVWFAPALETTEAPLPPQLDSCSLLFTHDAWRSRRRHRLGSLSAATHTHRACVYYIMYHIAGMCTESYEPFIVRHKMLEARSRSLQLFRELGGPATLCQPGVAAFSVRETRRRWRTRERIRFIYIYYRYVYVCI